MCAYGATWGHMGPYCPFGVTSGHLEPSGANMCSHGIPALFGFSRFLCCCEGRSRFCVDGPIESPHLWGLPVHEGGVVHGDEWGRGGASGTGAILELCIMYIDNPIQYCHFQCWVRCIANSGVQDCDSIYMKQFADVGNCAQSFRDLPCPGCLSDTTCQHGRKYERLLVKQL